MDKYRDLDVAVLLATYNGAKHVEQQIISLTKNFTRFTLHWLDDHSADNTREVVRATAQGLNLPLQECHHHQRLGLPGTFFQLLECVAADIYMFCDQDDVWEPGRIDAAVCYLILSIGSPVLCFADTILFYEDGSTPPCRHSRYIGTKNLARATQKPPSLLAFAPVHAAGHTQGFTRALRDIYLTHRTTARAYAFMHDLWIHDIAVASGIAHLLPESPSVFCRQHQESFSARLIEPTSNRIKQKWRLMQFFRRVMARHARGLVLASETLPPGKSFDRLMALSKLVARIDRRRSPLDLVRLLRLGGRFPSWSRTAWLCVACLSSSCKVTSQQRDLTSPRGVERDSEPAGNGR